jgi:hypothetical protein
MCANGHQQKNYLVALFDRCFLTNQLWSQHNERVVNKQLNIELQPAFQTGEFPEIHNISETNSINQQIDRLQAHSVVDARQETTLKSSFTHAPQLFYGQ